MRDPYYCPYCDHRSTRRWNLDVHIKRRHDGYLLNRSLNHMPNNPPLYSNSVQLRPVTVADNLGDPSQARYMPQQSPLGTFQYSANPIYPPVDVSQTFANPMNRPMQIMDDESYGTSLSQDTVFKIKQLKILLNKYPKYCTNPDGILKLAIFNSINRDDTLLDSMLEQFRRIDYLAKH